MLRTRDSLSDVSRKLPASDVEGNGQGTTGKGLEARTAFHDSHKFWHVGGKTIVLPVLFCQTSIDQWTSNSMIHIPKYTRDVSSSVKPLPVVPHKAVAEVSRIGRYRRGELLWCMDGRANPVMDQKDPKGGWSCAFWSGCNGCSGHLTTTDGCSVV